eukprot:2887059-Pyramimonas_sp.AAC.1
MGRRRVSRQKQKPILAHIEEQVPSVGAVVVQRVIHVRRAEVSLRERSDVGEELGYRSEVALAADEAGRE